MFPLVKFLFVHYTEIVLFSLSIVLNQNESFYTVILQQYVSCFSTTFLRNKGFRSNSVYTSSNYQKQPVLLNVMTKKQTNKQWLFFLDNLLFVMSQFKTFKY